MAHWTASRTKAHRNADKALEVVEAILSYVKDGKGKPSGSERALFAASVVFTYGIWENYVEQLAIEISEHVSDKLSADAVPDRIKKVLVKKTAWELAVSPGWRQLWVEHVQERAIGDDGEKYGMNSAKSGQVKDLLSLSGVSDPYVTLDKSTIPAYLDDNIEVTQAIDALVELRGEIVHTGKVPDLLRKSHVHDWRTFVDSACDKIDKACRLQCKALLD